MNSKAINKLDVFFDKLSKFIDDKELIKLVLSNKKEKSSDLKSIIISIVKLKKAYFLNFVFRHNTKDITKNFDFKEGQSLIRDYLDEVFFNAEAFSNNENLVLMSNRKGHINLKTKKASLTPLTVFSHDRVKTRLIKTQGNIYLRELGITSSNDIVSKTMTDKYRQINRYVELLVPYLNDIRW